MKNIILIIGLMFGLAFSGFSATNVYPSAVSSNNVDNLICYQYQLKTNRTYVVSRTNVTFGYASQLVVEPVAATSIFTQCFPIDPVWTLSVFETDEVRPNEAVLQKSGKKVKLTYELDPNRKYGVYWTNDSNHKLVVDSGKKGGNFSYVFPTNAVKNVTVVNESAVKSKNNKPVAKKVD